MDVKTLNDLLAGAEVDPDQPAVVTLTRETIGIHTRREVLDRSARLAAGLEQRGVSRGDRVVILAPNSTEWIVSALGVLHAGAVVVPVDTQMPGEDLAHVLDDCSPAAIITTSALHPRLADHEGQAQRFLLDDDSTATGWEALLTPEPVPARPEADDLAAIFYTSGTTGPPKGVPLTHANLGSNVAALCTQGLADHRDRVLVPLPFHHVYPFTVGLLIPFALGAAIVVPFSLVGPQIVRALREGEATVMLGVPRLYQALWDALHERVAGRGRVALTLFSTLHALSMASRQRLGWRLGARLFAGLHRRMAPRLRLMVSGGAALDPGLGRRLQGLGWEVAIGYGLSETSPILTINLPDRVRFDTVGVALPEVELAIDTPDDSGVGEVLARGPNVFRGYWNLPEKSREALDDAGWFHTGDLGRLDRCGHLSLQGRKSAMIVLSGGENVDPERVEDTLAAAAEIREAGVLAHRDRLAAVVVPEPALLRRHGGEELRRTVEAAVREASRDLPSHHRPGAVRITPDPLPRTRLGKLRRHKLHELFDRLAEGDAVAGMASTPLSPDAMAPEDQQLLSDPVAGRTWDYLARRFGDRRMTPDSTLAADLGIDSLGWVDLTLALREHAGIDLDDAAISRVESVRDLLKEAVGAARAEGVGETLSSSLRDPESRLDAAQQVALSPLGPGRRRLRSAMLGLIRLAGRGLLRIEVSGRLPAEGPWVMAPRHLSVLDPLVLLEVLDRRQMDALYWAGWTGLLFSSPLRRGFSRLAGVLPIDPGTAPRRSLLLAAACLQRGHCLVWFPEGRRSPDGRLQPFRPGLGRVLRAQGVPVVPVWIEGTRELMPPGRRWPKPGRVRVIIGDPVPPEQLPGDEDAITARLHDDMMALGEGRHGPDHST